MKHGNHAHRHNAHAHMHAHHGHRGEVDAREVEKRSVGQLISATIDGQVVSWTNEYAGPGVSNTNLPSPIANAPDEANAPAPEETVTSSSTIIKTMTVFPAVSTSPSPSIAPTSSSTAASEPSSSGWVRHAYYDAASGTAQGLTFLNHFGGTDGIPGTAAGGPA